MDRKTTTVPILQNHQRMVGTATVTITEAGGLRVRLSEPLTRSEFFEVFGNVGITVLESQVVNDVDLLVEVCIMEWSRSG